MLHDDSILLANNNCTWTESKVSAEDRADLMHQDAATIWLTGLSGSGKSTIAVELEKTLFLELGHAVYVLDGDNVRCGLNRDLGFQPEHRTENIRRIAEVAKLFNNAGILVVVAVISPCRADREMACEIIGEDRFIETFLAIDPKVCEQRDPKGLYKKARAGLISNFTGITAPYEPPLSPKLIIETGKLTVSECVAEILRCVLPRFRQS